MKTYKKIVITAFIILSALEALLWLKPVPREDIFPSYAFHRFLPGWNAYAGWFNTPPPFDAVFHSGRLAGVSTTEATFHVNRYGFIYDFKKATAPKKEKEIRIAAVGGSTVECIALAENKRWPSIVEAILTARFPDKNFNVFNLGISGQDTRTHLASVAQHAVKLNLDYIIFMLGANDLSRSRDNFDVFGGKGDLNKPSVQMCLKSLAKWLISSTQIGRRILIIYRSLHNHTNHEQELPYFTEAIEERKRLPPLPESLESSLHITPAALEDYATNLRSLAGLAEANSIKPIFMTQPMLWKKNMSAAEENVNWLGKIAKDGKLFRLSGAKSASLLESLNRRLLQECSRHNWTCIDMASLIPRDLRYFYDSVHFNEAGAELVATIVATRLIEMIENNQKPKILYNTPIPQARQTDMVQRKGHSS